MNLVSWMGERGILRKKNYKSASQIKIFTESKIINNIYYIDKKHY